MATNEPVRAPRETKAELVELDGKLFRAVYVGPIKSYGLAEEYWIYIGRIEVDTDREICTEPGCEAPATHQRFECATLDGTPIVVLVCRQHGDTPR